MKRAAVVGLLLAAAVAFFAAGGHEILSLENLKARRAEVEEFYRGRPFLALGGFFLLYLALATASLPGGVPLAILAGAVFGVLPAVLLASFASSIGALCAFFLGRYALRDWLERRYAAQLLKLNGEIDRNGAYYLFMLRFVPVFPLLLINFGMGLTRMRAWTFYWVSQLGMLPGQILFAAAGSHLAALESPLDVLSPGVVGVLLLIALLPLAVRIVGNRRQR
jgi:uncharacterized membrane protein YdjX (TVP38/TMEM64 family)